VQTARRNAPKPLTKLITLERMKIRILGANTNRGGPAALSKSLALGRMMAASPAGSNHHSELSKVPPEPPIGQPWKEDRRFCLVERRLLTSFLFDTNFAFRVVFFFAVSAGGM